MPHRANVSASSFVSNLVMSAQVSPSTNNSKERYPLCLEMYSRFNCSTTRTNSAVETPFLICTNYEKQPVPSGLPPFRFLQEIECLKKIPVLHSNVQMTFLTSVVFLPCPFLTVATKSPFRRRAFGTKASTQELPPIVCRGERSNISPLLSSNFHTTFFELCHNFLRYQTPNSEHISHIL